MYNILQNLQVLYSWKCMLSCYWRRHEWLISNSVVPSGYFLKIDNFLKFCFVMKVLNFFMIKLTCILLFVVHILNCKPMNHHNVFCRPFTRTCLLSLPVLVYMNVLSLFICRGWLMKKSFSFMRNTWMNKIRVFFTSFWRQEMMYGTRDCQMLLFQSNWLKLFSQLSAGFKQATPWWLDDNAYSWAWNISCSINMDLLSSLQGNVWLRLVIS